mmetsp:Transcript_157324/g.504680  ORF Transcript_157324/g.504680 Transcript_157324/m.504680 type:complete len:373 (-) Transcript_157324:542-1660(-)
MQCFVEHIRHQFGTALGNDLVGEVRPRKLLKVIDLDDVLLLGQACQLLDKLDRGARADGHPDDSSLGLKRIHGLRGATLAHGLAVGDNDHDGGCILATVHEFGLCFRQCHRGERRCLGPLEVTDQLGDPHGVVRQVFHPRDVAILLHVRNCGALNPGALFVVIPSRGPTEELQRDLHVVITALQVRDQVCHQLLRILPASGAEAATAVHENDEVQLRSALQELARRRLLVELRAGQGVAFPELQALLASRFGARARADCLVQHGPVTAVGATPARLGASAPLSPVRELALLVATLRPAALGLLGVFAWLAIVFHLHQYRPHTRTDTAATLGGAATPSLPLADDAIDGARVRVATLLEFERRALHAFHWMHHD